MLIFNGKKYFVPVFNNGEIIEVEELPKKEIRKNAFYLNRGKYYKRNETNVWVFNDEITIPEELWGKTCSLAFICNGYVMHSVYFYDDGACFSFYSDEQSYEHAYYTDDGWQYEGVNAITITEMPTDETLLAWIKANATVVGSWEEYAETTANSDKAETWVFNDELTRIDKPFENGFEDVTCSGYMLYDNVDEPFNFHFSTIRFTTDVVYLINDTDEISIYYIDNFLYNFRHGTITFTELPDDETFIAWLNANATKMSSGSGADDTIVGTWVFNDEITTFLQNFFTQEEHEDGAKYYSLKGYSIIDGEKAEFTEFYCYKAYAPAAAETDYAIVADGEDSCFMYENGWVMGKTITITEEPSTEVAAWLKANATKMGNPIVCNVQSPDELPSDAPDGSMALVDSESIIGTWYFNEQLSQISSYEGAGAITLCCLVDVKGNSTLFFNRLWLNGDANTLNEIEYSIQVDGNNTTAETSLYYSGWEDESYRTQKILKDPDDPAVKEWVKANARRISGGQSLYVKEYDEWVYKCEVV